MNSKIAITTAVLSILITLSPVCNAADTLQDEIVDSVLKNKIVESPYKQYHYNYEDTKRIPVQLSVIADIDSEKDVVEGQTVIFRVKNNVYQNGKKIIKKNDLVHSRVETIIKSGMNGIPASIIFGDFQFENLDSAKFSDTYEKYGQDRSLWVFPLKWALTPLPPTGSLTNFIKGGHAKLKEKEEITIYYHPNW